MTFSLGDRKFEEARRKYDEALSIVTNISGIAANDQKEIDGNLVACLMNIGATCIETMDFGEAVRPRCLPIARRDERRAFTRLPSAGRAAVFNAPPLWRLCFVFLLVFTT